MKKFRLADFILEPKGKLAKRMIYQDQQIIAFILNIAKGAALPNHTHFDCTVLIKVLSGKANVIVNNETIDLGTEELIQLDGPENMSVQNAGEETLTLYVTISPAPPSPQYAMDVDF